jgi:hypothetical protein
LTGRQERVVGNDQLDSGNLPVPDPVSRSVDRRFGDDEVARIMKKAIELQERSVTVSGDGRGLTLEDLRQIAREAGIDPRFVETAASSEIGAIGGQANVFAGGPVQWHFDTRVAGEISDAERERILQIIRSLIGQKGEVNEVFGRMEWSYDDGLGPVMVGISSREGQTDIAVSAVRQGEAGLFGGLGIPFAGIFGGAGIAGLIGIAGPAVLPLIAGIAGVSYGAFRLAWRRRAKWWENRLRALSERITTLVEDITPDGPSS